MVKPKLIGLLEHLCRGLAWRSPDVLDDAALLRRFAETQDQAAFAALACRHGPLVWSVCRRVLDHRHDAEDAFQATFLVLARKAGDIAEPQLLGNWLYGVASRIAVKARQRAARRRVEEQKAVAMLRPMENDAAEADELRPILDEEINRLPEKYRVLLVLCYFEGRSYEEAAYRLRCPAGTVSGRLARARALLRDRLERRGLGLTGAALAAALSEALARAAVPGPVLDTAIEASLLYAAGDAAAGGLVSQQTITLAQGVTQAMILTKAKLTLAALMLIGLAGGNALLSDAAADQPVPAAPRAVTSQATLNAAWIDLASADESKVVKAVLTLSKSPKEAVAFLRDNLLPVKADPKVVEQLVQQLNSDKFETRQRATEELEYLGKYIKDDLTKALAAAQGVEMKQRLQQLLDRLPDPAKDKAMPNLGKARSISTSIVNGQVRVVVDGVPLDLTPKAAAPVGPPMFWVRAARAAALLEHLGEPGAKPLLESLAGGEEDALPTQAARQALERLNKK